MNTRLFVCSAVLTGLLWPVRIALSQNPPPLPEPGAQAPQTMEGVEALTRGPIHEAFAEPVSNDPVASPVVPKQPPDPIEELPAEARPDDPNAEWVSGYWIWDDEQGEYLWVSGIWRSPPSGMRWVPGYWTQVQGGYQRVGGFWSPAADQEVMYLPTPPETVEAGPNVPAPSADHFWIPGYWAWETDRYMWRAGYWAPIQPDWCWVPAHYCWTPRGCVFIHGHWDYPLARRGVIFAPVHFDANVYSQPGFVYTPSVLINTQFLTSHFFVRPSYCHYYFGDYYADRYARFDFQPWYAFQRTRGWNDPVFVHERWRHSRSGDDWFDRQRANHDFFAQNQDLRPRHTFTEQQRFTRDLANRQDVNINNNLVQQVSLGASVRDALRGDVKTAQRLERVPDAQRREVRDQVNQMRDLAKQRVKTESGPIAQRGEGPAAGGLKLPEIAGRNAARTPERGDRPETPRVTEDRGPRERPETPRPDVSRPDAGRPDVSRPAPGQGPLTPPTTDRPEPRPETRNRPITPERPNPNRPGVDRPNLPDQPGERPNLDRPNPDRPIQPRQEVDRGPKFPDQPDPKRPDPDRIDPQRTRSKLPGAERTPDRIPGGTPGVGPSQAPAGQPPVGNQPRVPDVNDRRIPSGQGGARRPDLSPQVPQSGVSPRQPQNNAEREPTRQPNTGANRLSVPQGTRPNVQPDLTPQPRINPQPRSEPRVNPQPRSEPRAERNPTPAPTRRPEAAPAPRPEPKRVEAQRPNPSPAPPQARPAPSGGNRPAASPPPGRGAGPLGGGGGDKGKDKDRGKDKK